jgi:hypothetical protein
MAVQLQLPVVVEPVPLPEYVRGKLERLEYRIIARNARRAWRAEKAKIRRAAVRRRELARLEGISDSGQGDT